MPPKLIVITIAESGSICPSHLARRGPPPPYIAHGQGGYCLSASEVSAPPYGRRKPGEITQDQRRRTGTVPNCFERRPAASGSIVRDIDGVFGSLKVQEPPETLRGTFARKPLQGGSGRPFLLASGTEREPGELT